MKSQSFDSALEKRVADILVGQGYTVLPEPDPKSLPFDLGGYRPDLIAKRGDENLVIEVKGALRNVSFDHFKDIAELISKVPGWKFVLMSSDDIPSYQTTPVLSWSQIRQRIVDAKKVAVIDEASSLLLLWGAYEAALRRRCQEVHIPADRLAPLIMLNQLYSNGEVSIEQYDQARVIADVRNRSAHGFVVEGISQARTSLDSLLVELLNEWTPDSTFTNII